MRADRPLLLAAGLLSLGFNGVRSPGSDEPITWGGSSVTMVVHDQGSDDVTDGSDIAAIRAAMEVWAGPACSDFRFVDGGFYYPEDVYFYFRFLDDSLSRLCCFLPSKLLGSIL